MDNKIKTILLFALIGSFAVIDLTIFGLFTSLVLPSGSPTMQAKSIELGDYLPFEENSKIIKKKDNLTLTGEKPIIDSAAALYPIRRLLMLYTIKMILSMLMVIIHFHLNCK